MIFKDYYRILGLPNNKVDKNQIKMAYREQAKKYHPDVNNSRNEERFKDINEAYRVLSDQTSKRKYDRQWHRNVGRMNESYNKTNRTGSISSDFLNIVFGNIDDDIANEKSKNNVARRGENIETEITISVEDAFRGTEQAIGIKNADGKIKKYKIKVPEGIQNNEKIRISGQGKKGISGGKNGDLLINVKIDDSKKFVLDGYDLKSDLYLTPWEAALSSKVVFSGIDEEILVFVPAGIQSGEIIEIDDKGYKDGKGGRGKLILETKIMIPKKPTSDEIKLFRQLDKLSKYNPRA